MKLLAFDTSARRLSLALSDDETVLARKDSEYQKDLAEHMTGHIHKLLKKGGCPLKDLDAVIVGLGPGSFTGLRIGVSTAKALSFSLDIPVVGISSFDAIAGSLEETDEKVCVLADARRQLFYACLYEHKEGTVKKGSEPMLLPLDDLLERLSGRILFCGDGIPLAKEPIEEKQDIEAVFADKKNWTPQAQYLIAPALKRLREGQSDEAATLVPIYLYPEDCQVRP